MQVLNQCEVTGLVKDLNENLDITEDEISVDSNWINIAEYHLSCDIEYETIRLEKIFQYTLIRDCRNCNSAICYR